MESCYKATGQHQLDDRGLCSDHNFEQLWSNNLALKSQVLELRAELGKLRSRLANQPVVIEAVRCIFKDLHIGDDFPGVAQDLYLNNADKEKIYGKRLLLLGVTHFEELWNEVERYMRVPERGPRGTFSPKEKLVIALLWMRRGFPKVLLAVMCSLTNARIGTILDEVCEDLADWAKSMVELPSIDDWQHSLTEDFQKDFPNTLLFFFDGTALRVFNSELMAVNRGNWSPKHRIVAVTFTILVTPDGRIVFVSPLYPGKLRDRKVWFESGINKALVEKYWRLMLDLRENQNTPILAIGGDKGYMGLVLPELWRLYITKSAIKGADKEEAFGWDDIRQVKRIHQVIKITTNDGNRETSHSFSIGLVNPEMQVYPQFLAHYRSEVERTFAEVKEWQLLSNRHFTSNSMKGNADLVLLIVCALINFNRDNSI
jgi:hypothetical protein